MTDLLKQMAEALRNLCDAIQQIPEDLDGYLWKLDRPLEEAQEPLAKFDAQAAEQAAGGGESEIARLKEHAVTLANTTFLATIERCAQICEAHYNHEAKDCAEEIRAMATDAAAAPAPVQPVGDLPPLPPEPAGVVEIDCGPAPGGGREVLFADGYSANQMRDYARAALSARPEPSDAEIDALRRDAERYRWLRSLQSGHEAARIVNDKPTGMDAAIDAALAARGEKR